MFFHLEVIRTLLRGHTELEINKLNQLIIRQLCNLFAGNLFFILKFQIILLVQIPENHLQPNQLSCSQAPQLFVFQSSDTLSQIIVDFFFITHIVVIY